MNDYELKNIDKLLCDFTSYILERYRNGLKKPNILKKILSFLATTCMYIGFLILFAGISILDMLFTISDLIRSLIDIFYSKKNKQLLQSQNVEMSYQIREILCTILQENASVLGILKPNTVADITPVQYSVYTTLNGLNFLQFIAPYVEDASDLTVTRDFLNQKIAQFAQEYLYSLPVFYNDLCIYTVFEVQKDLYHPNCLCIKIAIIDSPEKYNYVVQHLTSKPTVSTNQVTDMEF